MKKSKQLQWGLLSALIAFSLFGCGFSSFLPPTSDFPTPPDIFVEPTDSGTPMPKAPYAGHWIATTDFGNFDFSINSSGTELTWVNINLSNWKCDGTIITMSLKAGSWSISDGEFSAEIDLNPPHVEYLTIDGTYDETAKTFSGTWDQDMYGTHCSGTWKSTDHK